MNESALPISQILHTFCFPVCIKGVLTAGDGIHFQCPGLYLPDSICFLPSLRNRPGPLLGLALTMGPKSSKEEDENSHNDNRHQGTVVTEDSSGFHIVEIHAPTAGIGIMTLVFLGIAACGMLYCWKKLRLRWRKGHRKKYDPYGRPPDEHLPPWKSHFAGHPEAANWFPLDRYRGLTRYSAPDFRNPWNPTVLAPDRFQEIHEPVVHRAHVLPPQRGLPPAFAPPAAVQPAAAGVEQPPVNNANPANNPADPNVVRIANAVAGE